MKLEKAKKIMEDVKIEETWIERDTIYSCRPCGIFSELGDVPTKYARSRKGNFGVVNMLKENQEKRRKCHITQ
jgi:hypothetical protein